MLEPIMSIPKRTLLMSWAMIVCRIITLPTIYKACQMSKLLQKTKRMLKHRDRTITLDHIVENTSLKRPWLDTMLYKDDQMDYSVRKVEELYTFLSKTELEL